MEVEETGETPKCFICDAEDPCQHLVATIDHSFLDCYGGEFCEREHDFRDQIEKTLMANAKAGSKPTWNVQEINQMWEWAAENYAKEHDYVEMDSDAFYRLVVDLLIDAGAIDHPGQVIDDGGPGMTSAITLLYSIDPKEVVQSALQSLKVALADVGTAEGSRDEKAGGE